MRPIACVETSVVSYLTAWPSQDVVVAAYQQVTREWWQDARDGFELVASELVVAEAAAGDQDAANSRLAALESVTLLEATDGAAKLAHRLLDQEAVPHNAADDAAHIAVANGVDYLVTWNFHHIANATMRSRIEHVCRQAGYEPAIICTPSELMESDNTGAPD